MRKTLTNSLRIIHFYVRFSSSCVGERMMLSIFEGRYSAFDQAPVVDQYEQANITQRIYQHSLSRYHTHSFFPDAIPNEYNHIRDITSLCISLLCAQTNEMLNILDIGGGFGVAYIELIKRCVLKNFNYTVCETNTFSQYYQSHPFFKEKNISFLSSSEEIKKQHQFLIFGSSLQYFEHYAIELKKIIERTQPHYILITHTPVTAHPTFATLQINMDNKKIPNWIFNIDALIKTFSENSYHCIFKSAIYRENLFDDFRGDEENYRSANFLFKKIT